MRNEIPTSIMLRFENAIKEPVMLQLRRTPNDAYIARHKRAWHEQAMSAERSIRLGIESLADMAAAYEARYGQAISLDYILGDYFASMARGLHGMLNGEIGNLDAGFCDAAILNIWYEAGFTEEL